MSRLMTRSEVESEMDDNLTVDQFAAAAIDMLKDIARKNKIPPNELLGSVVKQILKK